MVKKMKDFEVYQQKINTFMSVLFRIKNKVEINNLDTNYMAGIKNTMSRKIDSLIKDVGELSEAVTDRHEFEKNPGEYLKAKGEEHLAQVDTEIGAHLKVNSDKREAPTRIGEQITAQMKIDAKEKAIEDAQRAIDDKARQDKEEADRLYKIELQKPEEPQTVTEEDSFEETLVPALIDESINEEDYDEDDEFDDLDIG